MKRKISILLAAAILSMGTAYGAQGEFGYEGGVSTLSSSSITKASTSSSTSRTSTSTPTPTPNIQKGSFEYQYQEVVFITGKPVVYSGKVKATMTDKAVTYNYTLDGPDGGKLSRSVQLDAKYTMKGNQLIKELSLKNNGYNETLTIDGKSYKLDKNKISSFSGTTITDDRPAADYFAGNWNGRKVYSGAEGESITITTTGKLYGYDQFWGNAEVQEISVDIRSEKTGEEASDSWSGRVELKVSSTMAKRMIYDDNRPGEISFDGGYLQKQESNSVLHYEARLPEFDSEGIATDRMMTYKDDLYMQGFPQQSRLVVPDLKKVKGHWYENDVKELYSLEVLTGDTEGFLPNKYMSRSEFAKAIVQAGKIPVIEPQTTKTTTSSRSKLPQEVSPFVDVPVTDPNYKYIKALFDCGVMGGVGSNIFSPDDTITRAQALTIFVRVLGFESIAPNPTAVTTFRDNDSIPDWARNSVSVASYISLVRGDEYGNLNPNTPMTMGEASAFLNRFIKYMRADLVRDYRDRVMTY